ncbi:MAG: alpha/beta hydrolase [Nevskiaceae bacterium]|jgi:pimeloyl-ACP methyl ester carboxylesterase|nr:alpha/beta hydrolase [Nevskiaceae bacterium]
MRLIDPLLETFEDFVRRSAAQPGQSRYAQVAGIRVHYLEWPGPADAPTVLLLHGFLAHAHWWDFVAPWLATQYRIIAPDFGGMGDSQHRDSYRHQNFYDEIAGVIHAAHIAGCTAIGHSFGGRALLHACAQHPGLIERAIVVDSRLGSPEDPLRGFDDAWRPKKRYPDLATIIERFSLRPQEPAPRAALEHMARASIQQDNGAWMWKFDDRVTQVFQEGNRHGGIDDRSALAGLTLPVDFIYGEQSAVVTPARAAALAGSLPNVRSVTGLPGCYHHLPVSAPLALVGTLRALLQYRS